MASEGDANHVDSFLSLSRVLTGDPRLEADLAAEYYARLQEAFGAERLGRLLETFNGVGEDPPPAEAIRSEILEDEHLGPLAKETIMLWYMSGFRAPDARGEMRELGPETPEQYFRGLLWPTIRAHPLGLSGGYFGYWHYPPEN